MRNLLPSALLGLVLLSPAAAADLSPGWDRPAPTLIDDDDDDDDDGARRPRWHERAERRPPPARFRADPDDDDDEPRCWIRRTPYGPERVCR